MTQILCDGCGQPATGEHMAQRLRRLELATRFRPIHIGILFLAESPPARLEDYFYFVCEDPSAEQTQRAHPWGLLFDTLMTGAGISLGEGKRDMACLSEFQRQGFYLAEAIECPPAEPELDRRDSAVASSTLREEHPDLVLRRAPTVIKRIQFSYKPRHIAIISPGLASLLPLLEQAGLGDRLVLHEGRPFPFPQDVSAANVLRAAITDPVPGAAARAESAG